MMKKLLFLFSAVLFSAVSFAQFANIGILGSSTPAGWDADLDMTTTDGIIYTYENLLINVPATDAGVKFRQDDAWTTNWGGNGFPAGVASLNGPNIPAVNGTYNVTFNLNTLQYSFVATGFNNIALIGDNVNIEFLTTDGIIYIANNVSLPEGDYDFYMNGVVVPGTVSVAGNSYNITYNAESGESTFDFVTISLIGAGVVDWDTDVDLETEDGVNYTLSNFTFAGGEAKFRLNHDWSVAWGGTEFPSGTGDSSPGAPNLNIVQGVYDVTFNRESGEFAFAEVTAGIEDIAFASLKVYPNPAQSIWNFSSLYQIDSISIYDIAGKLVYTGTFKSPEAKVNADNLSSGIYYARLTSASSAGTVKLIKQ